ncbi:hypothetical protein QOZ80_8AG0628910 [Eleusine coracana subsp. coracana]|nr:hypothetical protein QOZ80_8AG0628910 [Eleusine coracana subsp. coracana]
MLCRSHAATAVCVPGDARSMVVARRADRTISAAASSDDARALHDVRYARLGDHQHRRSTSRRFSLTRGMTTAPPPPPPPPPPTTKPRRQRGRTQPVAVTLPMVTKSPVREKTARDLAAAAKRATTAVTTAAAAAPPGDQLLQVVVMKVAIHCQGCAGKVRKHISKMEGVTSFSIDLESKKVTVTGHVSPAGVLESISKVKKAELLVV